MCHDMQNQDKAFIEERVQKLLTEPGASLKADAFVYYGNITHKNQRLI